MAVDQLLLFSWAQHMVAPNKTGFLLEGEGGEWILGTQRVLWPQEYILQLSVPLVRHTTPADRGHMTTRINLNMLPFCLIHFCSFPALEKAMATHSSALAWRIPGMGEHDGLPSMGLHRVRHD